MDLSLWDPPDDQDYLTSQHKNEDHLLSDFSFDYGRDVIEEDALNERSCLQVLKILVNKADEEITKLEEDILKNHCQLAWCNESWSVPDSVALIEKIDHLNIWVQNLQNGNTADVHYPDLQLKQPLEQPQSLDEQRDRGITQISLSQQNGNTADVHYPDLQLKQPLEQPQSLDEQRDRGITQISLSQQNGNTADVHYPDLQLKQPLEQPQSLDEQRDRGITQISLSQQRDRGITQMSVLPNGGFNKVKSEIITSEDYKNSPKTYKRKSQPMERLEVDSMKQESKSPRKVRKASAAYKQANAIDKNVPSLKMKTSKFLETGRRHSFEMKGGEGCTRKVKLEHEKQEIGTHQTNLAKCMLREGKEMGSSSSSKQNVNVQQTCELVEISISKHGEKETQQQPNGKEKVASTSTSLPEMVTELPLSSETITRKKKYYRKVPVKMEIEDYDTSYSNRTTEETRDGVAGCRNDVQNLKVNDLKAICKKLNLRGYSKHSKAELIKLVGQVAPHLL